MFNWCCLMLTGKNSSNAAVCHKVKLFSCICRQIKWMLTYTACSSRPSPTAVTWLAWAHGCCTTHYKPWSTTLWLDLNWSCMHPTSTTMSIGTSLSSYLPGWCPHYTVLTISCWNMKQWLVILCTLSALCRYLLRNYCNGMMMLMN